MNGSRKVSVIIPCYNAGTFISDAINSVLAQKYQDIEIMVINDGSTDDTEKKIKPFLKDKRVRYLLQQNSGQAAARNNGIRNCTGDLIAFLDADDLWSENKLKIQLPVFDLSPAIGVVYTNVAHIDKNGNRIHSPRRPFHNGFITDKLLIDNFVTGMASIVRRECFDQVGLFDETLPMGVDWDLWLRISTRFEFHFLNKVTYLYRQWDGQLSRNFTTRYDCAIRIMNNFLEHNGHLLDKKIINEAWAHTFVGKGRCHAKFGRDRKSALREFIRALTYNMLYVPAWKSMARLLI
ncbi:MAG: glycosyltransferase, partial [Chitinivibrionales bacterium]